MAITAALVKELRERTGAGMMECKKALVETNGDIEAAIELMRKSGQAKAAKKAGRIAAEGVVMISIADDGKRGVMVEVNCETDFVAKDGNFGAFADAVAACALASDVADVDALVELPFEEEGATTIAQAREALVAKIGENIQVRRLVRFDDVQGQLYSYRHGVRIGVVVELEGGDETLGRDIAMHIAASSPLCVECRSGAGGHLGEGARYLSRPGAGERKAGEHRRQDHRGSGTQVHGRGDAARSGLRQGPGHDRREAAQAGRRQGDSLRPRRGRGGHREEGRRTSPRRSWLRSAAAEALAPPSTDPPEPNHVTHLAYRRILLKLSGEALMGDGDYGIDPAVIGRLADEVRDLVGRGCPGCAGDRRRQHLPRRGSRRRRGWTG